MKKVFSLNFMLIVSLMLVLAACGGGGGGGGNNSGPDEQYSTVTSQSALPVGDPNCPYGGAQIDVGIDENGNGLLDATEVDITEYVCNGADGADGMVALINTTALLPGDPDCPDGGYQVDSGLDLDGNSVLADSEVTTTNYICNGADGTNGLNGTDGLIALINTTGLLVGSPNCPYGGYRVDSGLDLDDDSVLDDSEVTSTSYLCNEISPPLVANTVSPYRIDLDWANMAGDPSVAFYDVYQDGYRIYSTPDGTFTSYSVTHLTPGALYCFTVVGIASDFTVAVTSPEACAPTDYPGVPDSWTSMSSAAPTARSNHSALWTGSKMIVWGGWNGADYLKNGKMYDPATDYWTSITTIDAPTARSNHTAVWTGSEMIVWGGESATGVENTGGVYDPATNSWTATSTTGAPDARNYHTAVWTGSEMIVWGGIQTLVLNTGGVYDPVTDTWTATSTTNAPSARKYHTAVWTGSEMIVWGGSGCCSLNTGGVYDPETDIWTATSVTGSVPLGRYYHSAVWTGSKMIVWGGNQGTAIKSGGLYDLATDTWTTTNGIGAPGERYLHTAVWTGSEMIVWGGNYNGTPINTGSTYDPDTNTWSWSSITDAPAARYDHTAVWTGSVMIIWGGVDSANCINTGGIYVP